MSSALWLRCCCLDVCDGTVLECGHGLGRGHPLDLGEPGEAVAMHAAAVAISGQNVVLERECRGVGDLRAINLFDAIRRFY